MNKKILIIFLVFQIIGCNTKEATQNEDRNTRAETVKPTSEEQTDEDDFTDEELIEFLSELNELEDKTEPGKIKQTPINNLGIPEDSVIEISSANQDILTKYLNLVIAIDKVRNDESKIELYAKTSDSDSLTYVPNNDEWPENTAISYNVFRDSKGEIRYLAAYPISESGDWSLGYRYYFEDGKTIVFIRESNFFNSECTNGVAVELSTYFFDSNFELISKEYDLKDTDDNELSDKRCFFPYHYEYEIECCLEDLVLKLKTDIKNTPPNNG